MSTAWLSKTDSNLKAALENTIATMQAVLERTLTSANKAAGPGNKPTPHQMELKLIQSKKDIEQPKVTIEAKKLTV